MLLGMRIVLAIVMVSLFGFGCGEGGTGGPTDLSGEWSYVWSPGGGEPELRGVMTLDQKGSAISGRLALPEGYPATAGWDMTVSGSTPEVMRISAGGLRAWDLDCDVALGAIACSTVQVDDGRSGSFLAER